MTMNLLLVSCFISIIHLMDADQLALTGTPVQLQCPYKATTTQHVIWNNFEAGTPVLLADNDYINTITLPPEVYNRLSVSGNHAAGEYHLDITDIRKSDEGRYECSSSTNVEKIDLTVIVGPTDVTIANITPDNKILGIEGQTMTIKCTAVGGRPPPDVQLVLLGSTYTGKQSAQHTFNPQRYDDGSTVTCQTGYTDINHFPFNTTAYIHLKLKPVLTPFSTDTLNTKETRSFDVSCQSTGSRPAATMYWLLGQQITNITSNSSTQSIHNSSADVYTVKSYLKYSVDRRYNGLVLICRASNVAGSMETFLTLNVKYTPDVTVENKTFSQSQTPRQIQSTLNSNPQVNICKWHHRSKYGEYIRQFSDNNLVLTLPTVPEDKRYQDTGEYVCTAENGITGINGQLQQIGSGYVISNAPPVITGDNKDNSTQYGKFGKSTKVYVNVYSIPKYSSISWYIGNIQLVSNKYVTNEEPAIVKDVFHGAEVQLDGYRFTLTISDLQEADFTNYTLLLHYSSQYVQHEVTLESASAPQTPLNFTIISSGETSVTFQWIPGYDGGQTQTFNIEYHISGTDTWMSQEIKTSNKLELHNIYTLSELRDKTTYELRMYAKNKFNQSQHTNIETITTISKELQMSSNAIIGTVAGVLVVLLIVCAVIISFLIFKKRKGKKKTKKNAGFYENSGFQNVQTGDEYEEVVSKSDTQEKHSVDHYEALGTNDKPNVYEELENQKGQAEKVYVNEAF